MGAMRPTGRPRRGAREKISSTEAVAATVGTFQDAQEGHPGLLPRRGAWSRSTAGGSEHGAGPLVRRADGTGNGFSVVARGTAQHLTNTRVDRVALDGTGSWNGSDWHGRRMEGWKEDAKEEKPKKKRTLGDSEQGPAPCEEFLEGQSSANCCHTRPADRLSSLELHRSTESSSAVGLISKWKRSVSRESQGLCTDSGIFFEPWARTPHASSKAVSEVRNCSSNVVPKLDRRKMGEKGRKCTATIP